MDRYSNWITHYSMLKEYVSKYGSIDGIGNYMVDGFNLGHWVKYQKRCYSGKAGRKLEKWQIEFLEKLGIKWDYSFDTWSINIKYLKEYYKEHKNLNIKRSYVVDGKPIGEWFSTIKYYHNSKSDLLDGKKIRILNKLETDWHPHCTSLFNKEITPNNKDEYFSKLNEVALEYLGDLKYENYNRINSKNKQEEISDILIKRLFR